MSKSSSVVYYAKWVWSTPFRLRDLFMGCGVEIRCPLCIGEAEAWAPPSTSQFKPLWSPFHLIQIPGQRLLETWLLGFSWFRRGQEIHPNVNGRHWAKVSGKIAWGFHSLSCVTDSSNSFELWTVNICLLITIRYKAHRRAPPTFV